MLFVLLCLPMVAQTDEPTSAAGYDFYFTLFDHWGWSGNSDAQTTKYCGFTVCAVEDGDLTLSVPTKTGDKFVHFGAYTNMAASLRSANDAILKGVHFHSTGACYLHVWAHGQNAGDETMILPKHLLGKKYMVQGVPGTRYYVEPNDIPTYSQFTVVGTENYTNVVITPKVQLRCVNRNNAVVPVGRQTNFRVLENEVLLFQPDDYTKDVSGTLIESDKVVAVFQGNTFTNIEDVVGGDFVWEQARPTDSWGKEFIVPKSVRTPNALCRLTALYDNTEVYYYMSGNKYLLKNLSAGESVEGTSILPVLHFEANQPVCCYLYTKRRETNEYIGGPSMTEIIPVDNMATETRWMLEQVDDNTSYKFSLFVTMRQEDEQKVKFNNNPLSTYINDGGGTRTVIDGFVTYEISISTYTASKLIAEEGAGFSAYILRIAKTVEASSFNISLPFKMPPPEFCPDGALLFKEDFGGNDPSDPVVSHTPVSGISHQFTQIYDTATCKGYGTGCVGMGAGRYLVAKRGYRNSTISTYSVWHIMDDHTSFGDTTTGYFLEIDGRETGQDVFYSTTMDGLCPGLELSFSTYIANVTTAGQYNAWRTGRGYVHPKLTFLISDPTTGAEIARYNTDTIAHDWSLFGVPDAWKQTANWQQIGMKFKVPEGVSTVRLSIRNNASGSTGNDFALDDIEVRLCMPGVSIDAPDTVCWGKTAQLQAEQEYPYMVYEPLFYRWEFSSDSINWTTVQNSTSETLTINRFKETNAGWYRVSMGAEGNVDSENCRSNSEPVRVEIDLCLPPVTIQAPDTVCIDTKNIFTALFENGGVMDEPLQYFWEFSSDSITWSPAQEGDAQQLKLKAKPRHTGWYRVTVFENGGTPTDFCHVTSEPFRLFVIEDCPPILCPEGILLFKEDFGGNDPNDPRISTMPIPGMTYNQLTDDSFGSMRSGSYLITKSGYCNGDTTINNAPQNRRSQWHLQDDHTYPNDNTRGYFMEIDGKGDNAAFYTTTIDGLCAGSDLSFMAYVANVMTWGQYVGSPGRYAYPRLLFRLTDPSNGAALGLYDTGEIPFDSTFINDYSCWKESSKWHQVGMNFTVPEGLSSVTLTIYNNAVGSIGNDFAIDDIEIRLCLEPITVEGVNPTCRKSPLTLKANYENFGILETPEYQWEFSADSTTWTVLQTGEDKTYSIDTVHRADEGWYRVVVANSGQTSMPNCRAESEPFRLNTVYCNTATDRYIDTVACDTLLPLAWRGHTWPEVGALIDTIRDIDIDDSLYIHLRLDTVTCCPEIVHIRVDSAVCDTLMPFLWLYQDTMVLFTDIGEQEIEYTHYKWIKCTGEVHTLVLDTFHCERLYPIIVNKYNWQLLLDHVSLRRFFPGYTPLRYQWYCDSVAIPGATIDDYSEDHELHGHFQLYVELDQGEHAWSNVIDLSDTPTPKPVLQRIYNAQGILVGEEKLSHGVYLIVYEQGDRIWTEKRFVP